MKSYILARGHPDNAPIDIVNPEVNMDKKGEYWLTLAQEYHRLGTRKRLSDSEADRLEKILEMAESNLDLSHLLDEVDVRIGHELNLLDEDSISYYEDQRAKLRKSLKIKQDNEELNDLEAIYK